MAKSGLKPSVDLRRKLRTTCEGTAWVQEGAILSPGVEARRRPMGACPAGSVQLMSERLT